MVHNHDALRTPTIVFDFDGTLALGHGPVLAFAERIGATLGAEFLARVAEGLRHYDEGAREFRDGYDIVSSLAVRAGFDAEALSTAYLDSRALLADEKTDVQTMPGLPDFLRTLRSSARTVLATNAPSTGVEKLLARWGAAELFDELHFAVGKPAGLTRIIADARERGPVLSIGDIFEYDLAPALQLGADTALIGSPAADPQLASASVTMRGGSLAELRGEIETWAVTAASSTSAPHGAPHRLER